jgi:hypothetical protein
MPPIMAHAKNKPILNLTKTTFHPSPLLAGFFMPEGTPQ